jgi:hypothetical protein
MPSIQDLPFEIISNILQFAAESNAREGVVATYTYGLTEAPRPLGKSQPHKYVRGRVPDDILRWKASDSIRNVCSVWHDWSIGYSMKKLYIRRWRGGERYVHAPGAGPVLLYSHCPFSLSLTFRGAVSSASIVCYTGRKVSGCECSYQHAITQPALAIAYHCYH